MIQSSCCRSIRLSRFTVGGRRNPGEKAPIQTFNNKNSKELVQTGRRVGNPQKLQNINIDRQRLKETEGTKYTGESNITRWKKTGVTDEQDAEREADEGVSSGVQTRGSWEV